jgi:hypothetical protein
MVCSKNCERVTPYSLTAMSICSRLLRKIEEYGSVVSFWPRHGYSSNYRFIQAAILTDRATILFVLLEVHMQKTVRANPDSA